MWKIQISSRVYRTIHLSQAVYGTGCAWSSPSHSVFLFFTSTWTLLEEVPYYSPIRGRRMWESCYSWEMKVSAFSFSAYAEVKKGQLQRWEKLISNTSAVWELCLPLFSVYCRLCPPNPSPRLVMNNKWKNTLSSYFYPQLFGFSKEWIYF